MAETARGAKFVLWIDAVGGYLVCLDEAIAIGRADAHGVADSVAADRVTADVAILADLAARHVEIRRDGEAYLIEPSRDARLDGQTIEETSALADGQLIGLGESVELRFRRPHALSGSARLELVSHHKTEPSSDGVLLLAESCVLGPGWQSHVVCRDWQHDLVLYRQGTRLFCRSDGPLTVNGTARDGGVELRPGDRIEGEDFAVTLEAA